MPKLKIVKRRGENYPFDIEHYLDHYKDKPYYIAMGWKPLDYENKTTKDNVLIVPEIKNYKINKEDKSMVAEKDNSEVFKSPYKKVKQTIEELDKEQLAHFKFNKWDGTPLEHHNMKELHATKELLESPNYYEIIPTGEPCKKENSLYLTIDQVWFDKIVSGKKTVEYREIKETTISKYLDMRESIEGYQLFSPYLSEEGVPFWDSYNEGIFAFTPRYYEYLRLGVGYNKNRDTAIIKVKGIGFVPEMYHKGGVWRADFMDESITDEMYQKAAKKGSKAIQDLFFKQDGPDTYWTLAIHLGEIVEVNKK